MANEWVEVFIALDHMEAELVKGLLEASQIPVIIEASGAKAMPFFFGPSAVGGKLGLKVPPDLADLAREILAARVETEE